MKKFHTIALVLGVALLAYLVWRIGPAQLGQELKVLGWGFVPFFLLELAGDVIHTLGWRHCLSKPYRDLSRLRLFGIWMAGSAVNYLTPSAALGGEVTKAALLSSSYKGTGAVSGVLLGKVCNAIGHILFVTLGSIVILSTVTLPAELWVTMLAGSALLGVGIVTFLMLQKHGKLGLIVRWMVARNLGGKTMQRAAGRITEVDEALKAFYKEHPRELILAVGWHFLGNTAGIFQTWVFFSSLGVHGGLVVATAAWVLGVWFDLLAFAVPLNLGTLEGGRIVALGALGYSALIGMTYGVTLRLAHLACAGIGLLGYGLLVSKKDGRESTATMRRISQRL